MYNPLHNPTHSIYLLAVFRASDKTVVASYTIRPEISIDALRDCISSTLKPSTSLSSFRANFISGHSQNIATLQDDRGRVYAIVTDADYQDRLSFGALQELLESFSRDFGQKCAHATENSLSKSARPIFEEIAQKYNNPQNFDVLSKINSKLEVVKSDMLKTIEQALSNTATLEHIEEKSEILEDKAKQFKSGATQLKNQMFWKMVRNYLLIGGLVVAVLLIIIVPLAVSTKHK